MKLEGSIKEIVELANELKADRNITIDRHASSITLRVKVNPQDVLYKPVSIDDVRITMLGVYDIKGLKVWVVKE